MSVIQSAARIDLDEILYQSVVDEEFRAQLVADPSLLGLGEQSLTLPTAIEPLNATGIDLASGEYYNSQMASTCSYGFTIICDTCAGK
ncbi:MAG: cinnamycin family lantibiotic [Pseudonocardiaceae bacterium]